MAIPNLIGLIGLSGIVVFETKRIKEKLKEEKEEKLNNKAEQSAKA